MRKHRVKKVGGKRKKKRKGLEIAKWRRGGRADRDTSPAPGALHNTHTHWLPVQKPLLFTHTRATQKLHTHTHTPDHYTWLGAGNHRVSRGWGETDMAIP